MLLYLLLFLCAIRVNEVIMNIHFQINELKQIIQKNFKQEAQIANGS